MQRILAATDFSAYAHDALERAAQLARASGAELHLLHAPRQGLWPQGTGMLSRYFGDGNTPVLDDDRARLGEVAGGLARRFRVRPECHVVPGRAAAEIASFAVAREVDLVVIGSRGEGGVRAQAVGGTALKVMWQSLAPVLLVRKPVEAAYRRMLLATDLSERSLYVCQTAMAMLPKVSPTLVHAFRGEYETTLELTGADAETLRQYQADVGAEAAERLEGFWKSVNADGRRRATRFVAHSHPVPAVLKAAADLRPDLVVLGKHSGAEWEERVLGSVVQNLLQQLRTDVLVVP